MKLAAVAEEESVHYHHNHRYDYHDEYVAETPSFLDDDGDDDSSCGDWAVPIPNVSSFFAHP